MIISAIKNNLNAKISNFKALNAVGLNFFRIKYLKHAIKSKIKHYKLYNLDISYIYGPDLLHSLLEIFVNSIYKIELSPNPLIIDCGANIGLSVIYFNKLLPGAKIIAYEPDDINFKLLNENVKQLNNGKVELNKSAVWVTNGFISFENTGGLGSKIGTGNESNNAKISCIRLRDKLIEKVDLLKMDIEGAEYNVICDIKDRLHFINNIFIEYHGNFEDQSHLLEILDIISKAGFLFYIKEALNIYTTPFFRKKGVHIYDIQLNLFCFRKTDLAV